MSGTTSQSVTGVASGTGNVGVPSSATSVPAIIAGAVGDGVTDDTAAIQAALNQAAAAGTGAGLSTNCIVYLLPGKDYIINNTLTIPHAVMLAVQGRGRGAARIKAGASFPINTAMIQLGSAVTPSFGCRIEGLDINCNNVAGSIGVTTVQAQEGSGIINCIISLYRDTGFNCATSGLNVICHFNEFFPSGSGSNYGVKIMDGDTSFINNSFVATAGTHTAAIYMHALSFLSGVHVEGHTDGILVTSGANGVIQVVDGPNSLMAVTTLVHLDGATDKNVTVTGLRKANATNVLKDDLRGLTFTDANFNSYHSKPLVTAGLYYHPEGTGGTSITVDSSSSTYFTVNALTAATAINAPTNPAKGRKLIFDFTQDATGGRTVTFNAVFKGVTLAASGTANQKAAIEFIYTGAEWQQLGVCAWHA